MRRRPSSTDTWLRYHRPTAVREQLKVASGTEKRLPTSEPIRVRRVRFFRRLRDRPEGAAPYLADAESAAAGRHSPPRPARALSTTNADAVFPAARGSSPARRWQLLRECRSGGPVPRKRPRGAFAPPSHTPRAWPTNHRQRIFPAWIEWTHRGRPSSGRRGSK